jgi:hypothetical protein
MVQHLISSLRFEVLEILKLVKVWIINEVISHSVSYKNRNCHMLSVIHLNMTYPIYSKYSMSKIKVFVVYCKFEFHCKTIKEDD